MSINPESLQNLLLEMNQQLQKNSAELQNLEAQLNSLNTSVLINKATLKELPPNDRVWKGVGKMFLSSKSEDYQKEIEDKQTTINDQVKALEIKKNYLKQSVETTAKNMNAILTGKPPN